MKRVPAIDLTWNEDEFGCDGVHTFENRLTWYRFSGNPHGSNVGVGQDFEDFLLNGPKIDHAPRHVLDRIKTLLLEYYSVEAQS